MLQLCVLAFSVLDNHSTRAFPSQRCHTAQSVSNYAIRAQGKMVEGVKMQKSAFIWCARVGSFKSFGEALQGFHYSWVPLSLVFHIVTTTHP